jgi:integrase
MPRDLSGSVLPRRLADGRLSFDVKIRDRRVKLGEEPEWDETRAKRLLEQVLIPAAKLRLDWWERIPATTARGRDGHSLVLDFHSVASEYVHSLSRYENANTRNAYISPVVKHLLPFFAYLDADRTIPRRLDEITGTLVTDFTLAKQAERQILRELSEVIGELDDAVLRDPDALAEQLDQREWELLQRYGQRGGRRVVDEGGAGRRISLSSRGLSNNEINRCLTRLRSIVAFANDTYELSLRDPTRHRFLPRVDPPRAWLRPDQFQALLDAAAELDASPARREYAGHGRRSAVLVLGLAGPRVSEFASARWRDFRGSEGVLHVPESKTSAGERDIELHQVVLEALADRHKLVSPKPSDFIWPTAAGTKRDRNNVRNRLLAPVIARADALLAERGQRPLPRSAGLSGASLEKAPPRVTPHTFRRTYLTYLAWAGHHQRFAMGQAGHKDAKLTLEVYQQPLPSKFDARVAEWLR